MQVKFRESFTKDLAAIKDAVILRKIKDSVEHLEEVKTPNQIFGIKKLKGYKTAYRLRIGDYRLGFFIEAGRIEVTRFLHRKEIYKRFP